MANTKLDRIERDIEKTRAKILEYQKRLKDLEAQKIEEENAQIVQMVKAVHLDGAQLAAFLSAYAVCPAKLDHTSRCKSGHGNRQ